MAGTDFSHLTNDELIKGIQALKLPDYIRSKAYGVDVRETLAQMTEMTIQLGVNMGLSPDDALKWARKLQDIDAQLAQTIKLDDSNLTLNNFTEEDRAVIQGLAPGEINAVLGERNVKNINISDNAVSERNVSFVSTDNDPTTNLFSGGYQKFHLRGDIETYGGSYSDETQTSRTAVIEIKPNQTYFIEKEKSNRFRIAVDYRRPQSGREVGRFVKDAHSTENESEDTFFTFESKEGEYYLIITVSSNNEEPELKVFAEPKEIEFTREISSKNIVKSKNLFDGNYIKGFINGGDVTFREDDNYLSAIIEIEPNTTYTVSKTISNRFRVALGAGDYPHDGSRLWYVKDATTSDSETSFTFTTRDIDRFLIVYVARLSDGTPPTFLQIEKGSKATSWETYGYKIEPQAKRYEDMRITGSSDVLSVEDFRESVDETDSVVIQRAFNNANGQVVSFESGKKYEIDTTVVAMASRVRGIKGNNATLVLTGDIVGLKYEGTLSAASNPESSNNKELDITEGNAFIERLKVTSKEGHVGTGIRVGKLLNANIESCHTFNLKYGLTIKGRNRNLILSNCHIRDNFQAGLFLDAVNLHQLNMTGMHIAYSRNPIYVLDSHVYNWQMVGSDIESNGQNSYGGSESVIYIGKRIGGTSVIHELSFSGLTIQDHNSNTNPMVNIELDGNELSYFSLGDTHMSNSKPTQPLLYIKGGNRISISNLTLKNEGGIDKSLVFGEDVRNLVITGSNIEGEIVYADVQNLIIANNITHGFNLEDTRNENVLISNNLQSTY